MAVMNHIVKMEWKLLRRTGTVCFDVILWLESEIGERDIEWDYWFTNHSFFFKTEENKVKFILKWM